MSSHHNNTPQPAHKTRRQLQARSGRSSRRQRNWAEANKPWFGPVEKRFVNPPCEKCFMIRTHCTCE